MYMSTRLSVQQRDGAIRDECREREKRTKTKGRVNRGRWGGGGQRELADHLNSYRSKYILVETRETFLPNSRESPSRIYPRYV